MHAETPRDGSGEAALGALDRLLADRPDRVSHDFSAAMRCLTDFREHMLGHARREDTTQARERLARLNAVISVFYGGQFPIGAVPWKHLEKARDGFAALLQELNAAEPPNAGTG